VNDPAVTIESLAAGGDGVARLSNGMTVFVPRTAPGDRVRLREMRLRKRHAHGELAEVVEPGPDRVDPPCEHFVKEGCGGCQWQHLGIAAQERAKRRIVGDALRRIGRLEVPDPVLLSSPRKLGYRATISLAVRFTGGDPVVGFHTTDGARVFELRRCEVAREELNRLWEAIAPARAALPVGPEVRLTLRVAPDGGLHVLASGGHGVWATAAPLANAARAAGLEVTVWWQPEEGAPRRMAGRPADKASLSFEQVNPEVAELLRSAVVEETVRAPVGLRVLDLYGGAGELALRLADMAMDVVMVELDERAVWRAETRAANQGLKLRCIAGRVEDWLGKLPPADVVIVNPPRTGLSEAVARVLASRMPPRLIYVSCDPATLARDLARLEIGKDELVTLRAYDMFPQTSHVETLAVVERR
jgi:23S rRNA (uracil1939-C5)-methyltransferase